MNVEGFFLLLFPLANIGIAPFIVACFLNSGKVKYGIVECLHLIENYLLWQKSTMKKFQIIKGKFYL